MNKSHYKAEDIDACVDKAIRKHVNGHIDELHKLLATHIEKHDNFMVEIEPVLKGYRTINNIRSFLVWTTPLVTVFASAWWFFKGLAK